MWSGQGDYGFIGMQANSTAQSIDNVGSTVVLFGTGSTTFGVNGGDCVASAVTGTITIATHGRYAVFCTGQVTMPNNTYTLTLSLFVGSTQKSYLERVQVANEIYRFSLCGVVDVASGTSITLMAKNDTGAANYVFDDISLIAIRLA